MRAPALIRAACVPALVLLAGCGDDPGVTACPPVVLPSLQVEVVDAVTGARRTNNARGWWIAGDQAGSLERDPIAGGGLVAYGPPGRYSLIVQAPNYQSWGRDDLRVEGDECGPEALDVRVELVATPPPTE